MWESLPQGFTTTNLLLRCTSPRKGERAWKMFSLPTSYGSQDSGCCNPVKWKCVCLRSKAKWINPAFHSFLLLSGCDAKETILHMTLCVLSLESRPLNDICTVPMPIHIYMKSLFPRTHCWLQRQKIITICHQIVLVVLSHLAEDGIALVSMGKSVSLHSAAGRLFSSPSASSKLQSPSGCSPGRDKSGAGGRQREVRMWVCRQAQSKST